MRTCEREELENLHKRGYEKEFESLYTEYNRLYAKYNCRYGDRHAFQIQASVIIDWLEEHDCPIIADNYRSILKWSLTKND